MHWRGLGSVAKTTNLCALPQVYLFFDTRERKERFLWRAILALLRLFKDRLLRLDFDQALRLLRGLPAFDVEQYFACLQHDVRALPGSKYAALRKKAGIDIVAAFAGNMKF